MKKKKISKKKIIKYLDKRIGWHSGGESAKSMNEIITDDCIVTELQLMKKNLFDK